MHPRSSFVSLAKAGAQEPRVCRCHGTDLSAADIPLARCSGFLSKDVTLRAAETVVVRCPSGRHPVLRGPWIPAFAGKTMREIGAKPGPFRVFPTSATLSMFPPRSPSFPPRKRGPRSRGGAAATERISAQRLFRPARCRGCFRPVGPVLGPGCDRGHALVADSLWSSVEIHSDPVRTLLYPYA